MVCILAISLAVFTQRQQLKADRHVITARTNVIIRGHIKLHTVEHFQRGFGGWRFHNSKYLYLNRYKCY